MWLTIVLTLTILDLAAESAEKFWTQVSAIKCIEQVTQIRLNSDEKVMARHSSTFDYVVTLKMNGTALIVDESRIPQKASGDESSLLLTSGFPALLLIFHPDFRDRFEFDVSEPQDKIAFRLRAGARSMSAIKSNGRLYPIRWNGVAWVDPANGGIRRIEAWADSMAEIGIEELKAEVDYGSVPLLGQPVPYWLPSRATISLRSSRQRWRNVHEFGSYKVFAVTSTTRPGEKEP